VVIVRTKAEHIPVGYDLLEVFEDTLREAHLLMRPLPFVFPTEKLTARILLNRERFDGLFDGTCKR